jgi:hypothetical protein
MLREGFSAVPLLPLRLRPGKSWLEEPVFPGIRLSTLPTLRFPPPELCLFSEDSLIFTVSPLAQEQTVLIQTP